MSKEEKLRNKVLKGLKKPPSRWNTMGITFDGMDDCLKPLEPNFHCHAIISVNNTTGEIRMTSKMPLDNNVAFLKYVDHMEKTLGGKSK